VLLDHLLDALDVRAVLNGRDGVEIADLAYDSRRVVPGALFVCVPGATVDGHDHAAGAVAAGAAAVVSERALEVDVPQVVVHDARSAMAPLADRFFGEPTRTLRVAAVTGTNGKTTTAYVTRAILDAAGIRSGLLGTIEQVVGGVAEPVERTTPEAIDLQRTFRRMLDAGDRAGAMEVSSHALDLHRVDGVRFAAAAFTNLSQDHLDFHGSMEEYFAAKARLFDGRCPTATNDGDPYGSRLDATVRYGSETAEIRAEDVHLDAGGSRFRLVTPAGAAAVQTRLRGAFNVANVLAAASLAHLMEVPLEAVAAGIESVEGVPGRLEPVEAGQPFTVLVDYAHTPDALQTVLTTARGITRGRLIVVFGCGGDRDRAKRPAMGKAAAGLADVVVVTSDNPRSEDPLAIIDEVVAGIPSGTHPVVVADRRLAIREALAGREAGDVVVVAGKGHESGQTAGGVTVPFDDRVVAREELARLGWDTRGDGMAG
jgi:UDP-N-acetylmuramoyl-L-alanyl-D-glutamate--2,6-diaminopimelate ligase